MRFIYIYTILGLKGFSPAFIAQVNDWLATLENNRRRARALSDQKQRSHSGRSPRGTGRGRGRGLSRRLSGIGVEDPIDGIDPNTPSVRRGRDVVVVEEVRQLVVDAYSLTKIVQIVQ